MIKTLQITLTLLLLLALSSQIGLAQTTSKKVENRESDQASTELESQKKVEDEMSETRTNGRENSKRKAEARDTVFKPSEEISEDTPVPFPVDI